MFSLKSNNSCNNILFSAAKIGRMTKNKPHPSFVRLLNSAKKIGFEGHSALAKSLSQSEQTITNWAARGVSKQGAILAQEHFQLSPKWIIDGVGDEKIGPEPSNVKPAPQRTEVAIISWVAAGKLTEIVDYWDEDLGSVTPSKSKPGKRAFALIQAIAPLQQAAQAAGLGLWADAQPVAPWDWRRR